MIERRALFGVAEAMLAERLSRESARRAQFDTVAWVDDLADSRRPFRRAQSCWTRKS